MLNKNDKTGNTYEYDREKKVFTLHGSDEVLPITESEYKRFFEILDEVLLKEPPFMEDQEFYARNEDKSISVYYVTFAAPSKDSRLLISVREVDRQGHFDPLTGLLNRNGLISWIKEQTSSKKDSLDGALMVYFDIQRFKAVNDIYGSETGNQLLILISEVIESEVGSDGIGCRFDSDRFAFVVKDYGGNKEAFMEGFMKKLEKIDLSFQVNYNAGVFEITDGTIKAETMIDCAILAQSQIKGSYSRLFAFYNEHLRQELLTEQEISSMMKQGIAEKQFQVYYQPQFDHTNGRIVGAEALIRWIHPVKGIISPGLFIPVFEKNGFITQLDLYVFEEVCLFVRKCLDENKKVVPISTNLTRYDIFSSDFVKKLDKIRKKYDIPTELVRVEITESAAIGNSKGINDAIRELHDYGFIVEMDDFGSGYSSLNILKEINFDIIKLDMMFLRTDESTEGKAGIILSSIVRMVNWLGLPIIAEGVETVRQADFLNSIGCNHIQGFLYSKPLPEKEFCELLQEAECEKNISTLEMMDAAQIDNIWSNESMDSLIFNNFAGPSAIFEYRDGAITLIRANEKYFSEYRMYLESDQMLSHNLGEYFDAEQNQIFVETIEKAIQTKKEQYCDTWRNIYSRCCGEERICIRTNISIIAKSKQSYLCYATIRNVTEEKLYQEKVQQNNKRFSVASEQAGIYYWQYDVETKNMYPCSRCMRDLGLPQILENYPESAFEMGVFPPEVSEMYRDWHRQIASGVPYLEAVIPLTMDRIPYKVRYTTEFDEKGNAVRAYGSATPVE